MSPWDVITRQLTRLSDRIELLPTVREASVTVLDPLTIRFDTDTEGTLAFGTLASGLRVGSRVLTVRLARYVWVLGERGGGDTGWVTSGLTITTITDWSVSSYQLRRIGARVFGNITLQYSGATITPAANNNITDVTGVIQMPVGWQNTAPDDVYSHADRSGVTTWFTRCMRFGDSTDGRIDLTHGVNGQSLGDGDLLTFTIDYLAD